MTTPLPPKVSVGLHKMIIAVTPVHLRVIHTPGNSGDRDVVIIVIMREVLDELLLSRRRLVHGRHILMMIVVPWPNHPIIDMFRHVAVIAECGGLLVAEVVGDPEHVAAVRVKEFATGFGEALQGVVKGGGIFQLRRDLWSEGWKGYYLLEWSGGPWW